MTKKRLSIFLSVILSMVLLLTFTSSASAQESGPADEPIVQAVLFFSPSCGHCEYVRAEVFPLLYEKYGVQLDIAEIDITTESGHALFGQVIQLLEVPEGQRGVPFLIIEDTYMVGSEEIPDKFPKLISTELQGDGTHWPDIPALLEHIQTQQNLVNIDEAAPTPEPDQVSSDGQEETEESTNSQPVSAAVTPQADDEPDPPLWLVNFQKDVTANSIAVVVLIGMIIAVIYTGVIFMRGQTLKLWPWWITPILVVIGFVVAAYLGVIEVLDGDPFCGPVGECEAVQSSPYARLFGVIHIGVIGMIGYVTIGIVWAIGRWGKEEWRGMANMGLFAFSVIGTLFSIYLTFLEPFVIGATCMWCIASAIVMTLLMLNATPIALASWLVFDEEDFDDEFEDDED